MDKQHPQSVHGSEKQRKYGAFQNEIYRGQPPQNHLYTQDGMFYHKLPTVTTDPNHLEEQAKSRLASTAYNYVAGGAGERATMDANRLAFRQWKMFALRLAFHISSALLLRISRFTVLGDPSIANHATYAPTVEEVAESNGDGHRWYQLYWPQDDDITISLLKRARANGYKVLVVTLDTWALAWRPADLDGGYVPFMKGVGDRTGFTDPVFREKFQKKFNATPEEKLFEASQEWVGDVFSGAAHTWEQISLLKANWDGPIVLKGIQHPDDARLAVDAGVDGIIVSNHGGRQLDGAIGSLEMLPEIVEAVGDKLTVLFDSGIRTGVDVIKALCLGAKAVLIGRPAIYGLAVGGKEGARQVLQGILADVDQSMGLAGISNIEGCNRSMVRRVQYGGDVIANN
ncbi:putative L-lactate dehydrogenase protein [Rutstroemia sp. NJR-2017a WRK4]|nr:putative L-lactate dehydrogenase protein [Rutstroemia sp. NJR-2017a WRK4]